MNINNCKCIDCKFCYIDDITFEIKCRKRRGKSIKVLNPNITHKFIVRDLDVIRCKSYHYICHIYDDLPF